MKTKTIIPLAALAIIALAGRSASAGAPATLDTGADTMTPEELDAALQQWGIDDPTWRAFILATARRESRFRAGAINRNDASAARRGWRRNAAKYEACDIPPERYQIGSVGLYQLLPTSGMQAFLGTPMACADPIVTLSDPHAATYAAVAYARRVRGWKAWRDGPRTLTAMAAAWSAPSRARNPAPKYRERMRKHLAALGLDPDLADAELPPTPEVSPPWT